MRILIATPLTPSQSGGPAQYAFNLRLSLESFDHTVDTISFVKVSHLPSVLRHIYLFFQAMSHVRESDFIIILDTVSMAVPVLLAALLYRKTAVIRVGGDFLWEQYTERTKEKILLREFYECTRTSFTYKERLILLIQKYFVLRLANTLVFSSEWLASIWQEPYNLKTKIVTIENAYLPYPKPPLQEKRSRTVVWIGRELALKNVDSLDAAIEKLQKKQCAVEYKKFSDLTHAQVLETLKTSGLLVIPSLSEVSPNLVLEALALNVPVILTAECGIYNRLTDAVTWVNPKSVDAIAQSIEYTLTDAGYREACARAASFNLVRTYNEIAKEFLLLANTHV